MAMSIVPSSEEHPNCGENGNVNNRAAKSCVVKPRKAPEHTDEMKQNTEIGDNAVELNVQNAMNKTSISPESQGASGYGYWGAWGIRELRKTRVPS